MTLIKTIDARFQSGNSVPVERVHITAEEWVELKASMQAVQESVIPDGYKVIRIELWQSIRALVLHGTDWNEGTHAKIYRPLISSMVKNPAYFDAAPSQAESVPKEPWQKIAEGLDAERKEIMAEIHWPECWDTACYDTLASAMAELYTHFKCSDEDCAVPLPVNAELQTALQAREQRLVEALKVAAARFEYTGDIWSANDCTKAIAESTRGEQG